MVTKPLARRQSDWSKFMQLLRVRDVPDSTKMLAHRFGVAVMTTAERREKMREKVRLKREEREARREARRARRREKLQGNVVKALGFMPSGLTPRFLQKDSVGAQTAPAAAGDPSVAEKKRSKLWTRARSALGLSNTSTSQSSSTDVPDASMMDQSMDPSMVDQTMDPSMVSIMEDNPILELRDSFGTAEEADAEAEEDKKKAYVPLQARSRPRSILGAISATISAQYLGDISRIGVPSARARGCHMASA